MSTGFKNWFTLAGFALSYHNRPHYNGRKWIDTLTDKEAKEMWAKFQSRQIYLKSWQKTSLKQRVDSIKGE